MKNALGFVGCLALLPAARAHESWAPHTHAFANQNSDIFVLFATGLLAPIAGLVLVRAWRRKNHPLKSTRVPRRRS